MTSAAADDLETGLLADGCVALMRVVFGDDNWYRFQEMRHLTQLADVQSFFSWLLDLGERELDADQDKQSFTPPPPPVKQKIVVYVNKKPTQVEVEVEEEKPLAVVGDEVTVPVAGQPLLLEYRHENYKSFFCPRCNTSMAHMGEVNQHLVSSHLHLQVAPHIECSCCQRSAPLKEFAKSHGGGRAARSGGKTIPPTPPNRNALACKYCPKTFLTRQNFTLHVNNEHFGTGVTYPCPYCSRVFLRPDSLCKHKKCCASK